jgi:hypothetical protein
LNRVSNLCLFLSPEAVFHKLINQILGRIKSKNLNIKMVSPMAFQFDPDEYHQVPML